MDKVSADNDKSKIWGEYEPGAIFWDEVVAPENLALIDPNTIARELTDSELRKRKKGIREVERALAEWEYRSYPKRLQYYQHRAATAEMPDERKHWKAQYVEARNNPPEKPAQPGRFARLFHRAPEKPAVVIDSEKAAQRARLWLDRQQKRIAEHETSVKNKAIYEQLANEMLLEVSYFAQKIIQRWTALGYREEIYIKGKRKLKKVAFEEAVYTEDEIQYKIRVSSLSLIGATQHHLPEEVTAWNLVKPETLSELTVSCERPVGSPHIENTIETFQNGAWVVVYREGLTDGLFDYIEYSKVIVKYDESNRHRFPVPVGVLRGRLVQWLYLDEHPHLMVNGISGSGKTNIIRIALITWTQYHSPDEIRIFIVDLKRGGDFRRFANVPHLAAPTMISIEQMAQAMPRLVALMYQRMDMFNQRSVRDIIEFNRNWPDERMQQIVVIIDECSAINSLADRQTADYIWRCMTLIATQARAAGIHLLLGTQQSFSDAIPKAVRDNITFILSGRQRTLAASMATSGTGVTKRLPKIRGRMWCDDGGDHFQIQTPFVPIGDEEAAVKVAMEYGQFSPLLLPAASDEIEEGEALPVPPPALAPTFEIEDVIRIAIEQFEGALSRPKIYAQMPKNVRVTQVQVGDMIRQIGAMESVEHEGALYSVRPNGKGWRLEQSSIQADPSESYLAEAGD